MTAMDPWEQLQRPGPESVLVDGVELRAGSRVRLKPRRGGDVFDVVLAGRTAVVASLEWDMDDRVQLAVTADDDPGRDLGEARMPGHRFFFTPEEVEPLERPFQNAGGRRRPPRGAGSPGGRAVFLPMPPASAAPSCGARHPRSGPLRPPSCSETTSEPERILVAGIGNVFLGDDGFGVELAGLLAGRELPAGVRVVDYGIRGMDLAYALHDGWDTVVLLDATPRGQAPGTLYVIEAEPDTDGDGGFDAHGMDPVQVLALARRLGPADGVLPRILVVGCEPETRMSGDEEDVVAELSASVRGALDEAVKLVGSLLAELTEDHQPEGRIP